MAHGGSHAPAQTESPARVADIPGAATPQQSVPQQDYWSKLTPLLEQAGHRIVTFDLPAHGEDSSPISSASLQSYTDLAAQALDQQPEIEAFSDGVFAIALTLLILEVKIPAF